MNRVTASEPAETPTRRKVATETGPSLHDGTKVCDACGAPDRETFLSAYASGWVPGKVYLLTEEEAAVLAENS